MHVVALIFGQDALTLIALCIGREGEVQVNNRAHGADRCRHRDASLLAGRADSQDQVAAGGLPQHDDILRFDSHSQKILISVNTVFRADGERVLRSEPVIDREDVPAGTFRRFNRVIISPCRLAGHKSAAVNIEAVFVFAGSGDFDVLHADIFVRKSANLHIP